MNSLKKLFASGIAVAFLSPFFYSCGSNEGTGESDGSDTIETESGGMTKSGGGAQNIFYAIPSPIELAQLIQKAGATYNKDLLNPIDNVSKYNSNSSKALNLGVYGADLSYTSVFDNNTQESILYLGCTRKLAESLGVGNAFDEKTVDRIQANTGKKDSLLSIISDSYMSTDEMLKESQRENASALVIAGGYIEGIYLGTQLAKASKNGADIVNRIAEQKGTLDNVIGLLSASGSDAAVLVILEDMKALQTIFTEVQVNTATAASVKTDQATKVTTIGGKIVYTVTPATFEKLTAKAAEIRTKIISGQN
ncbi:MAG: hypothetical protein EPN85_05390 [Bacteroidetes bacterium]|nr:MAG: hypothetical protein EPN85_05390 [Bacteroidota bacterium]